MQVFTEDWLSKIQKQYERLPSYSRPITYHIAFSDRYKYLRSEIEEYLSLVPKESHDDLVARLRSEDHIFQTHRELAVGAQLVTTCQVSLKYEQKYKIDDNELTPDWTVCNDAGESLCVVEVITDNPSEDLVSKEHEEAYLYARLQEIEIGALLSVDINNTSILNQQLSARTVKNVEQWLQAKPVVKDTYDFEGINITLLEWNERYSQVQFFGSADAFLVNTYPLKNKIADKARKYKHVTRDGVPLMVAVYSEPRTGRGLDNLLKVLFGERGLFVDTNYLSGVIWLYRDLTNSMRIHLVQNPNSAIKLPKELTLFEERDYSSDLRLLGKAIILINTASIHEYEEGMMFFWRQIVHLHMTLYLIEKIIHFPFDLFNIGQPAFFSMVVNNFVDVVTLNLNRLVNDQDRNVYNILQFRDRILELMKPEYHDSYFKQLKGTEFDSSTRESCKIVKIIADNRLLHSKSDPDSSILLKEARLTIAELMQLRDAVTRLYDALQFQDVENVWLVLDYLPNRVDQVTYGSRSDIERLLDSVARESSILNAPERNPMMWERHKEYLSADQLETINSYRRKFKLAEV